MEEQIKKRQHITVEILKILEANGCTAAEALEILDFSKKTVVLTAKVNADWPRDNA